MMMLYCKLFLFYKNKVHSGPFGAEIDYTWEVAERAEDCIFLCGGSENRQIEVNFSKCGLANEDCISEAKLRGFPF